MDIAKRINPADGYVELDRQHPEAQSKDLKDNNPYGFDVVVEATGVEKSADESINYVRRGGTLMIYGVYENKALVHWPPSKVHAVLIASHSSSDIFPFLLADFFGDEIEVSYVDLRKTLVLMFHL